MRQNTERLRELGRTEPPGREFPVLFHLMDITRQRSTGGRSAQTPTIAERDVAGGDPASKTASEPSPLTPVAAAPRVEMAIEPPAAESEAPQPVDLQPAAVRSPAATPASSPPAPRFALDRPIELHVAPTGTNDERAEEPKSPASAVNAELLPSAEPVTPRPPLEPRRRLRTPFTEDWFAAHGRYIAVVFIIALIGTIYLARTTRRPARVPVESLPTVNAHTPSAPSATPAKSFSPPAVAASDAQAQPKLIESSSSAGETRAVLHAPATTDVAGGKSDPAHSHPGQPQVDEQSRDNLFVFPQTKKADERVAARPVTSSAAASAPVPAMTSSVMPPPTGSPAPGLVAGPSLTPAIPAAPSSAAPSLAPAYPTTVTPQVSYPTTVPAQYSYPTTSAPPLHEATAPAGPPRVAPGAPVSHQPLYPQQPAYPTTSSRPPQAGNAHSPTWQPPAQAMAPAAAAPGAWLPNSPGTWSPPATAGGMPPQYQPPSTASGLRNERTGSSLY